MNKTFILVVIILLLIPVIRAGGVPGTKIATFVSKYSSRSMDPDTYEYYQKIKENYNVYIVQDSSVAGDSHDWKTASQISDLVFVTALSHKMLNESKDAFCENLGHILTESVGLIFAGNSLIFYSNNTPDGTINTSSCIYTDYFDFGHAAPNTEITDNKIKISEYHEITEGYETKEYNLAQSNKIYPIVSPKNGLNLATVYGDPDGSGSMVIGPDDYPTVVLWQGIRHNTLVWGLTTSEMEGCTDCLGWDLFEQIIDWISDEENMGFEIYTDKEVYFLDETINIDVQSHVDIEDIKGKIIYPTGREEELYFTGSGKFWSSMYPFEVGDPPGNYTISTTIDTLNIRKEVIVKTMEIDIDVINNTKEVEIYVDLKDKYNDLLENGNMNITITKPSGIQSSYNFEDTSSAHLIYNVTESGIHVVYISAQGNGGSQSKTESFYFKLKPKLTFIPENITETVNYPQNLTRSITISNDGNESVANVVPKSGGEIGDWIDFNDTPFSLGKGNSTYLSLEISVPEVGEGEHKGFINFSSSEGSDIFPITVEIDYLGQLSVKPQSYQEVFSTGEIRELEYQLENIGKGSLEIKSITPSQQIEEWVHVSNQPRLIPSGGRASLKVLVSTQGVDVEGMLKTISGNLEIVTDLGTYDSPPSLSFKVYSDISKKAEGFYPDLVEIERKLEDLKEKTDVTEFQEEVDNIRLKIMQVQELYNNEQLESAYEKYNSIQSEIDNLESKVDQKETELEQRKQKTITIAIIAVGVLVGIIILYIIIKKLKGKSEYGWLYQKWKNR